MGIRKSQLKTTLPLKTKLFSFIYRTLPFSKAFFIKRVVDHVDSSAFYQLKEWGEEAKEAFMDIFEKIQLKLDLSEKQIDQYSICAVYNLGLNKYSPKHRKAMKNHNLFEYYLDTLQILADYQYKPAIEEIERIARIYGDSSSVSKIFTILNKYSEKALEILSERIKKGDEMQRYAIQRIADHGPAAYDMLVYSLKNYNESSIEKYGDIYSSLVYCGEKAIPILLEEKAKTRISDECNYKYYWLLTALAMLQYKPVLEEIKNIIVERKAKAGYGGSIGLLDIRIIRIVVMSIQKVKKRGHNRAVLMSMLVYYGQEGIELLKKYLEKETVDEYKEMIKALIAIEPEINRTKYMRMWR